MTTLVLPEHGVFYMEMDANSSTYPTTPIPPPAHVPKVVVVRSAPRPCPIRRLRAAYQKQAEKGRQHHDVAAIFSRIHASTSFRTPSSIRSLGADTRIN
jgi:hypothetical protein